MNYTRFYLLIACAQTLIADGWHTGPNWPAVEEQVQHAVVQIINRSQSKNHLEPYKAAEGSGMSTGSGFFINEDGEILTNYHVVCGAKKLEIALPTLSSERFEVALVGCKPERDIALLKLTEKSKKAFSDFLEKVPGCNGIIQHLELSPYDTQHPADEVMAVGYPLGDGLKRTIGHISGISQIHGKIFCQISAPINPGNSGGPTVNGNGTVIGINSAGVTSAQNVGYMIPVHHIRHALDDMRANQLVTFNLTRAGMLTQQGTKHLLAAYNCPHEGLFIYDVVKDSFADEAGLKPHDIICKLNDESLDNYGFVDASKRWIKSKVKFFDIIDAAPTGSLCTFTVWRNGALHEINAVIPAHKPFTIDYHYPEESMPEYRAFGGIVVQPLTLNLSGDGEQGRECMHALFSYLSAGDNALEQRLMITKVHEGTQAEIEPALNIGSIIESVNGHVVRTVQDLDQALAATEGEYAVLIFIDKTVGIMHVPTMLEEDEELRTVYHYEQAPGLAALKE
jgi:serine protease Do